MHLPQCRRMSCDETGAAVGRRPLRRRRHLSRRTHLPPEPEAEAIARFAECRGGERGSSGPASSPELPSKPQGGNRGLELRRPGRQLLLLLRLHPRDRRLLAFLRFAHDPWVEQLVAIAVANERHRRFALCRSSGGWLWLRRRFHARLGRLRCDFPVRCFWLLPRLISKQASIRSCGTGFRRPTAVFLDDLISHHILYATEKSQQSCCFFLFLTRLINHLEITIVGIIFEINLENQLRKYMANSVNYHPLYKATLVTESYNIPPFCFS